MKKLSKAFLFYFSLIAISVVLQSCCTNHYKIIGSGTVSAHLLDDEFRSPTDTITGSFELTVEYEQEYSSLGNFSFIASTMATTCADDPLNMINTDELKISCDKDFIFDGNTIAAGSDLANLEGVIMNYSAFSGNFLTYTFDQTFIDKVTFENEIFTFKVLSKTDDGLELETVGSFFMNL